MAIPFTQYLRPDGDLARACIAEGVRFEVEHLRTGEASFEAVVTDEDGDAVPLACEIVENGPAVPDAIDRLVRAAHASLTESA